MKAQELIDDLYKGQAIEPVEEVRGLSTSSHEMICGCDEMDECADCEK
jgi:hypothetical protein